MEDRRLYVRFRLVRFGYVSPNFVRRVPECVIRLDERETWVVFGNVVKI